MRSVFVGWLDSFAFGVETESMGTDLEAQFCDLRQAIVAGNRDLVFALIDELMPASSGNDVPDIRIVAARRALVAILAGRKLEAFRMVRRAFQEEEPEFNFETFGEIPISQLKLRVRTINILSRNAVNVVGDLEGVEKDEILDWENCGPAVLSEIDAALRDGYMQWQQARQPHEPS